MQQQQSSADTSVFYSFLFLLTQYTAQNPEDKETRGCMRGETIIKKRKSDPRQSSDRDVITQVVQSK